MNSEAEVANKRGELPITPTASVVLGRELASRFEATAYGDDLQQFEHQEESIRAIIDFLGRDGARGYVEMATSTGKSYVMSRVVEAAAALGMRTLILAPTTKIADQLYGEDGTQGLGRFTDMVKQGVVGRRYESYRDIADRDTIVSTYQSLNRFAVTEDMGRFDLIIGDEAHMSLGEKTSQNVNDFSPNAIKLGFTATPEYRPDKSTRDLYGESIHSLNIRETIERGLTPPARVIIYRTGEHIDHLDPQIGDFTFRELDRLRTIKARNDAIITFTKNFVAQGQQGIVACLPGADHAHVRFIENALSHTTVTVDDEERLIRAGSVGSHKSHDENRLVLAAYEAGELDVVAFVRSLEVGWDSARPRFAINASPTTSQVRTGQLFGRLLRGNDEVTYVDFLDEARKYQITALHVLGEETINTRRTHGGKHSGETRPQFYDPLSYILDPELYDRILTTEGMKLRDLYFSETQSKAEGLRTHYERILTEEGMPSELLPGYVTLPHQLGHRAVLKAFHAIGDPAATIEEVTAYVLDNDLLGKDKTYHRERQRSIISAAYANLRPATLDDVEIVTGDTTVAVAELHALQDHTHQLIDRNLSERAMHMINRTWFDGAHYAAVGAELGVRRQRSHQIYRDSFSALRSVADNTGKELRHFIKQSSADLSERLRENPNLRPVRPSQSIRMTFPTETVFMFHKIEGSTVRYFAPASEYNRSKERLTEHITSFYRDGISAGIVDGKRMDDSKLSEKMHDIERFLERYMHSIEKAGYAFKAPYLDTITDHAFWTGYLNSLSFYHSLDSNTLSH